MAEKIILGKYSFSKSPQGNLFIFNNDFANIEPLELVISADSSNKTKIKLNVEDIILTSLDKALKEIEDLKDYLIKTYSLDCIQLKARSSGNLWFYGYIFYDEEIDSCAFVIFLKNEGYAHSIRLEISLSIFDSGVPRWMAPGYFYKHNRFENNARLYPCYSPDRFNPVKFICNYWSFKSDKLSTPCVFAWRNNISAFITAPASIKDQTTSFFLRSDRGPADIGFNFPYSESPVKFSFCHADKINPDEKFYHIDDGEVIIFNFTIGYANYNLHYYAKILNVLYQRLSIYNLTNPWLGFDDARRTLADGLINWHYDDLKNVIYDTCAFDKYFGIKGRYINRPHMHVSRGGILIAFSLLYYGIYIEDYKFVDAASKILDHIANGLAPCGTFYGLWTEESGWHTGWNPEEHWIHTRTIAEATFFMMRALRLEMKNGRSHPNWMKALKLNLDFIEGVQNVDGNFGSYYNFKTGKVEEWDGAGGILWIAPLAAAAKIFQHKKYLDAAIRAAEYYSKFIEDEFIYGASEDDHLAPTAEDAYNAVISYLLLYETNPNEKWLNLAKKAADYALTFRFTYNSIFHETTLLGKYDFRTIGGDISSPANPFICNGGLIMHSEILKLSYYGESEIYEKRSNDHLKFALQFIAREDGDFGARKGMKPEQIFHTDWWQPKGKLLTLSHAYSMALALYGILAEIKFERFKREREAGLRDITLQY